MDFFYNWKRKSLYCIVRELIHTTTIMRQLQCVRSKIPLLVSLSLSLPFHANVLLQILGVIAFVLWVVRVGQLKQKWGEI